MRIPSCLKVGAFEYQVICGHVFRERSDLIGQCDHDCLEVRLCSEHSGIPFCEARLAEVFLHEVIHAVEEVFLPSDSRLSESQVELLSKGLLLVLRENKLTFLGGDS